MTFRQLQDMAIKRFKEALRPDLQEWIRFAYGEIWQLEEWTFKQATATVSVTAGSSTVTGVPADFGLPHDLRNAQGDRVHWLDPDAFRRYYQGATGTGLPADFTVVGAGLGAQMLVGPISGETSAAYSLFYERDHGFYPSTALTGPVTLPSSTIAVTATAGMPNTGTILIAGRPILYTGVSPTAFTGCSGGTGTFAAGETVTVLAAQAGLLAADSDVPMLPLDTHMILVHAAQAIGQSTENDYSIYLSDDRVQQALDVMRRRYLVAQRGEVVQWGDGHVYAGAW